MITIKEILENIDESNMVRGRDVPLYELFASEFGINDLYYVPDSLRISYCYYYSWVCTDTEVGMRIWYLDDTPVCISVKRFRKSSEIFYWISERRFNETQKYAKTLIDDPDLSPCFAEDHVIAEVYEGLESIDYKKHERINVITSS